MPRGEAGQTPAALLHELVDRMAHQLKNPMQAIVVNLEVIRSRAGGGTEGPADLEPFATAVEESVHLLDRRLRLLFQVARAHGEPAVALDAGRLLTDLVAALHLDREPVPVLLRELPELPAVARAGHLIAALYRGLELAGRKAAGSVEVLGSVVGGRPSLEVREGGAAHDVSAGAQETAARDGETGPTGRGRRAGVAAPPPTTGRDWETVDRLARGAGVEVEWGARGDLPLVFRFSPP